MPAYWSGSPLLEGSTIWKLTAAPEPGMNPVSIYGNFRGHLNDYWLTNVCSQENGIATISVHTDDQTEIKKNLNKAIEEQNSRKRFAREYQEFYDAAKREDEMQALYDEISSMEEVIKSVGMPDSYSGKDPGRIGGCQCADFEKTGGRYLPGSDLSK